MPSFVYQQYIYINLINKWNITADIIHHNQFLEAFFVQQKLLLTLQTELLQLTMDYCIQYYV